jgi:hypothetical protein
VFFLFQALSSLEGLPSSLHVEDMGDVDKLLKDISLTLKKFQTPTKSISSIISS